jgi:hypothetical protein
MVIIISSSVRYCSPALDRRDIARLLRLSAGTRDFITLMERGGITVDVLLLALGITGFLALVDIAALRWGSDSRDAGDLPIWLRRHPRASI